MILKTHPYFSVSTWAQTAPELEITDNQGVVAGGSERIVNSGTPYEVKVRPKPAIEIDKCSIKFGDGSSLKILESTNQNEYKYYGEGFAKGDCGISFGSINPNRNGRISFTVSYPTLDVESTTTFMLKVATQPTKVEVSTNKDDLEKGDQLKITCTAFGARPEPTLKLFLGKYIHFFNKIQKNQPCTWGVPTLFGYTIFMQAKYF
jgi:hypothetical protein